MGIEIVNRGAAGCIGWLDDERRAYWRHRITGHFEDTSAGNGGGFLPRRLMMKIIGSAIAAGMPNSTRKIIEMMTRSGPGKSINLAKDTIV